MIPRPDLANWHCITMPGRDDTCLPDGLYGQGGRALAFCRDDPCGHPPSEGDKPLPYGLLFVWRARLHAIVWAQRFADGENPDYSSISKHAGKKLK
jgi:hypothetical protein